MQPWQDRPADLTRWILGARPPKNRLDAQRAYGVFTESEPDAGGRVIDVLTVLLTNRECPFRCLMCDLWRNTLDHPTPAGAIPDQIRDAMRRFPDFGAIKLYNAGNFFDGQAIPRADWPRMGELLRGVERVIVESHPKLIGRHTTAFRDLIAGRLEVAIGLETAHEGVLERLNKQMTLDDFKRAVAWLRKQDIDVRAFILLRPPFLSESEGVTWARRSIDLAFDAGAQCCVVIPTRGGNGAMERLAESGHFEPPSLDSLEVVLDYGVALNRGRVFADLWDLERLHAGAPNLDARLERLRRINLTQTVSPPVSILVEAPT